MADHRPRALATVAPVALLMLLSACSGTGADDPVAVVSTDTSIDDSSTTGEATEASAGCEGFSPDDPFMIRFASFSNTGDSFMQESTWFMDQVEERTDGAIVFDRYFDASLVPATDNFEAITDDRVEMGIAANVYEPAALPLSQITIPFAAQDGMALIRTVHELYETNEAFRREYEAQGVKPLAWGFVGTSTGGFTEPVSDLDDLSGLRLRTAGLLADALAEVDAEPVFMELGETYEAVDRGVLDGWVGFPLSTATQANLQEIAKHWVDTGVGVFALTSVAVVSLDTWQEICPEFQEVMLQVGEDLLDVSPQIAQETQSAACDVLQEAGVTVTRLPGDEVEAWRERVFEDIALPKWRAAAREGGVSDADIESFEQDFFRLYDQHEENSEFVDPFVECADRSE